MKKQILITLILCQCLSFMHVIAKDYTRGLAVWFDTPTTLEKRALWFYNRPDLWIEQGKKMPNQIWNWNMADPSWERASLPIGNGNIGANILGSVEAERITFNEKTLWRGGPNTAKGASYYWNVNKKAYDKLPEIRQAFIDGDDAKALKITQTNFNGLAHYEPRDESPFRFGNFVTMGEFYIETGLSVIGMSQYKRVLSLDEGMAVVQFKKDGVNYERNYFTSYPNNVMVVRFKADKPGKQNLAFSYMPNSVSTGHMEANGANELVYKARLDNNQMEYVVRIQAHAKGGKLTNANNKLTVTGADEVVFLITADTDYKMNFNPDFTDAKTYVGVNPSETTRQWMEKAAALSYEELYAIHYADYSNLFNRVKFAINPAEKSANLPTPVRLANYKKGQKDFYLESLYYQFGRYLLIASSRPGNMPANLQGIWHNHMDGPWRVDYHNNINLQMNYWPACSGNLAECTLPLFDFIKTLVKPGQVTAQSYYNARGWTASVSANIFGFTAPLSSVNMSWNFCPMAGPWLSTHAWDYYEYTQDKTFLKETGYELLKSSAEFTVDYLWHKPDGTYTAAPSTSPEHGPIDQGTAFAHGVVREILMDAIAASKVLKVDAKERRQWQHVLDNLAPYRIGRYGQLMEWSKDIDDPEDQHRHVNHLFGLHPGRTISPVTTPELAEASKVVLNHRGDGATGWSMGWKLNQWARLHDGNHAYKLYGNLLKNGTANNLWDVHPPFQIDGNFGGAAGVVEMLVQSHMGFIQLLPALPDAWKDGKITGVCAKGNFELAIKWQGGKLTEANVISNAGSTCSLRYNDSVLEFPTKKGHQYTIVYEGNKLVRK